MTHLTIDDLDGPLQQDPLINHMFNLGWKFYLRDPCNPKIRDKILCIELGGFNFSIMLCMSKDGNDCQIRLDAVMDDSIEENAISPPLPL